jgi:hypothetical protein
LTPPSETGKLVAIFFIPLAVAAMTQWLGLVANFIIDGRSAQFRRQLQERELTQKDLDIMDVNGDGQVSRAEFLEFMLLAMKKIDNDLVEELRHHFDKLDADGTGELSRADLVAGAKRKLKSPQHKLQLAAYKQSLMEKVHGNQTGSSSWGNFLSVSVRGFGL